MSKKDEKVKKHDKRKKIDKTKKVGKIKNKKNSVVESRREIYKFDKLSRRYYIWNLLKATIENDNKPKIIREQRHRKNENTIKAKIL
jgi:ribosomal protein S1